MWKMFTQAYTKDTEIGRININMGKILYPCVVIVLIVNWIGRYFVSSTVVDIICVCLYIPIFIAFTIHHNKIKHIMDRDELISKIKADIQEK